MFVQQDSARLNPWIKVNRSISFKDRITSILDSVPERRKLTGHGAIHKIRVLRTFPTGKPKASSRYVVHAANIAPVDARRYRQLGVQGNARRRPVESASP